MTYQVLARKWRPRNFREMAGQGHVLKTLINSLDNDRLHHAYLFTGTRGVGKTTIARILARCLNCEQGVTSEPCGKCSACTEIDEGRFIDLIEVDAASRTKVEDTRELLDNVQYSPTRGRYKVYLIDEVHMLSGHSFNALLKTLEEPPPHVKFLLATTDPQKLPVTVLSRCLQFNLKKLSPERLVEHIKHILDEEKIPYEEPALWQLGRAAQGSVRDCLTLLDQAIGYCEGNVTDSEVRAFLGTIDQAVIHQLVDALAGQDAGAMLEIVETAADHAPDFAAVLADLLSYLHRVAIAQVLPAGIDNSQGDRDRVLAHAEQIPAENLQLFYQIALKGREDMPYAIDARSGLEMALLRMLAFTPEGVPDLPAAGLAVEQTAPVDAAGLKKKPAVNEPGAAAPAPKAQQPQQVKKTEQAEAGNESAREAPVPSTVPGVPDSAPDGKAVVTEAAVAVRPGRKTAAQDAKTQTRHTGTGKVPVSAESSLNRDPVTLETLTPATWIPLFYQLDLDGITRSIASNCLLAEAAGGKIILTLDESQTSVYNEEHKRRINNALNGYFGRELQLEVEPGPIDAETPAAFRARMEQERLQKAIETFENDELVQEIVERFSGDIQLDSIEPTTPKHY